MRKYLIWILGLAGIFWVVLFIVLVNKPKHESLLDAKIPEETKEFFRNLASQGSEVTIDFIKKLTKRDFDNNYDFGKKSENGFQILEDNNFIVYFRNTKTEASRAHSTLRYANAAIEPLKSFFGTYFFPSSTESRKLTLYLAANKNDYMETCKGLGFESPNWSAAVTLMVYDNYGKAICKGIVIGETVQDNSQNNLEKVIWHEMAHFTHFLAVDLSQKKKFLNWEIEGTASYFAKEDRPINRDKIKSIQLEEQLENYLDTYWVGNSVFQYVTSNYGNTAVPK